MVERFIMRDLIIIDGYNLIYRAYYSMMRSRFVSRKGYDVGAVYGFVKTLLFLIGEFPNALFVVAMDGGGGTPFRRVIYDKYKQNRKPMPTELRFQIPIIEKIISYLGIKSFKLESYEADDIIANLAIEAKDLGYKVTIISKDKDLMQLIDDDIKQLVFDKGNDYDIYGSKQVYEKFDVYPEQVIDLLAIMGDKSDNIPGVPGAGPKLAVQLLKSAGSILNMIMKPATVAHIKSSEKIFNNLESLRMSYELVELKYRSEIPFKISDITPIIVNYDRICRIFDNLGMNKLLNDEIFSGKKTKSNDTKLGGFMFIPQIEERFIYEEELVGLYSTRYKPTHEILSCKRNIVIHNDIDFKRSLFENIHTVKCTIINLSVVDGRYHYESNFNPSEVIIKTVYNGYLLIPLDAMENEVKITENALSKAKFKIINAYTSNIGLWSINSNYDMFSPIGLSILDMVDLKMAMARTRSYVSILGANTSIKLEVSFDGDVYRTVLPLPLPQFYTRMHAKQSGEDPIITSINMSDFEDICDENTKVSTVRFNRKTSRGDLDYKYDTDINSETVYYDHDDKIINIFSIIEKVSVTNESVIFRSICDEIYGKMFKFFNRYQLSSMNFVFDSRRNILMIPSMTFSFDIAPKDFAVTVIEEIVTDSEILNNFQDFVNYFGDIIFIGRITDLKYDTTIRFDNCHKIDERIKSIRYSSSIFDIVNSLNTFDTSVLSPISMMY